MWLVEISKAAEKELSLSPNEVRDSFDAWRALIELSGPQGVQRVNGYWDHSLKGEWKGARASSLNRQWRVIYVVDGQAIKVLVLKITAHDYRRR